MTISVIIPVKPGGRVRALAPLEHVEYPAELHEVIVAEGRRPSSQRNRAAHAARGDILYFLDDDSLIDSANLKRLSRMFADPGVAAAGGPSLTPVDDTPLQHAFGLALASPLGGGAVRNRYRRSGVVRSTDDSELILCNLAFRRSVFVAAGGLDARLYPNEENELMDRIKSGGGQLLHDPDLVVHRSQRATVRAYLRQLFTYGRGRGEQTRISRSCKIVSFLPTLFLLYVMVLVLVLPAWPVWVPLGCYLAGVVGEAARSLIAGATPATAVHLLWTVPALHLCYGAGLVAGMIRPRHAHPGAGDGEVTLRIVKPFDGRGGTEQAGHMA